ncbi:SAM-dependent methyltransferase [Herbaspirillum sp. meg3]|uniref:class I SAM-dependent methyltransferase n=1 Tax=Herbaspirillum sp. meg3 TaxID=2025949 RepID=UPI000B98DF6A|nr:class I SAM-dependent methyltransferase [Herbaspirillum sp. meg3]ASU39212.1 SAM-dependent methyltransferase [Herbaspirillum sp. meg3]
MEQKVAGIAGYGENAEHLAEQYESIEFEDVYRDVLHLFPTQPSEILDIGAGSGRDSAALARKGHAVTAIEPTKELREEGQLRHSMKNIHWIDDHLPTLKVAKQQARSFDVILLTAVWMHLEKEERKIAMKVISELLRLRGKIIMTLRHGPVPDGRQMFDVSAQETVELAGQSGLQVRHVSERQDMFSRNDVSWSIVVLEKI